ncbi:MAG TPA: putative baseplate assembly protein [Pseudonocardiaceae bacterium]|nr:putative baseplate assembly protein [Pseudonocardiaceae bacterium]
MALPVPNLDDRRFQDLVDDAKRMVQQRCPMWTDHNVSDPGVTLIETFAFMVDQLLYRLNRVPDRLHLKFLDLIGLRLLPPTPARAWVTFWLTTPALAPMAIPAGTGVGTIRTETTESIVFSSTEELTAVPGQMTAVRTRVVTAEQSTDRTDEWEMRTPFAAFATRPSPGDQLLIGLNDPLAACALRLDFDGTVEGIGVNPRHPPLSWQAWTAAGWVDCELALDETGGLNRGGSIIIHLPADHEASVLDGARAAWVRAIVIDAEPGQPAYSAAPIVHGLIACTVGVSGEVVNAEIVDNEPLGQSEGVPGQTFRVRSGPMLAGLGDPLVQVSSDEGWTDWLPVEHFAASEPGDRHVIIDAFAGEILFGPAVRLPDGGLRQHGAVPPKGAAVRIARYAIGGGARGNVAAGTINTLKSSVPFVSSVDNRASAHGGVDGETLPQAQARGPLLLHTRGRAVTMEDYTTLAKQAAPEVARVHCVTAGQDGTEVGSVRVLVVPTAATDRGRIHFADLVPSAHTLRRLAERLDEVRLIGSRVLVGPPKYRGITVIARLVTWPRAKTSRVTEDALDALYEYLSPLPGGGPNGTGWPFGRAVAPGDLYAVLQGVRGVESVEDVRLFTANPLTGERGKEARRVEIEPNSLIFSFDHQVRVEEHR